MVFSVSVYSVVSNQIWSESRSDLRRLAEAVIASIDFDSEEDRRAAKPDSIMSEMPSTSGPLEAMRLEWFDPNGKFVAAKGKLSVTLPLTKSERFDQLSNPQALVYTKPVVLNDHVLGFVRVAEPLRQEIRTINNLLLGLLAGTTLGLITSGIGTAILVRNAVAPIRKNMNQLRKFTSDASHELRNPITAILTNSSVALNWTEGMRDGDKEKFLLIQNASQQMQKLVEDLLSLSRAENREAENAQTNLLSCVQAVVASTEPSIKEKNCIVEIEIENSINVQMKAEDLRRVVSNLLDNAIQYSHSGGTIRLQASKKNSHIELAVADTGIGIANDDLEKVFDRFWRADKARNYSDGGQGLGLSIVQALLRQNGGDVTVKSEEGRGSTFTVSLKSSPHNPPITSRT
ncbi:MAG TPA: HAMP domain-containing sensor histidine kinase [Drouetiella sp.]